MAEKGIGDPAFYERLQGIVHDAYINVGLAIGSQLGLFKAMTELKQPFNAEELAHATGCHSK
jgi:hypothetical protein